MVGTSAGRVGTPGRALVAAVSAFVVAVAVGCSGADSAELCTEFASMGRQVVLYQDNFGSALFDDIDTLGTLAVDEADEGVKADGRRLREIAGERRTTVAELSSASRNIARQCGASSIETRVELEQNMPGLGPPSSPGPSRPTTTFGR